MGRGRLSESEIEILRNNPYVDEVNERQIFYSGEFKLLFIEEYMKGKKPKEIFTEAGFDAKMLGSKRIERACARWKESYESGTLNSEKKSREIRGSQRKTRKAPCDAAEIKELKERQLDICHGYTETIRKLQAENEMLKQFCGMMTDGKTLGSKEKCHIIREVTKQEEYRGCVTYLCQSAGISRNTYYYYQ